MPFLRRMEIRQFVGHPMGGARSCLRPLLDVLPTLVVIGMLAVVGVQAALGGWSGFDRRLAAFALIGTLMEIGGCLVDLMGTAALETRALGWRLAGFLMSLAVMWFLALPALVLAHLVGASPFLLAVGFVVPRFLAVVWMPPRDELERLRVLAYANDRAFSLRLGVLLGMPAWSTCIAIVAIQRGFGGEVSGWVVAAACAGIAAWLALAVAASWNAWSPVFGRFPQRLLNREPWFGLLDRFTSADLRKARALERDAELERARAWQARVTG